MPAYFIVNVRIKDATKRELYNEYILKVKSVAESYGGRYIIRSEQITPLSDSWKPDRFITLRFDSKEKIFEWLSSPEYNQIAKLRIESVESDAIIVEESET